MMLESQVGDGHILTHTWLFDAFGLDKPGPMTPNEIAREAQWAFLQAFKPFQEHLLLEHRIALARVRGTGWRIVPPPEQVQWAEREGDHEIRKAIARRGLRINYIRMDEFTTSERQQQTDALARLGRLRQAFANSSNRALF